MKFPLPRLFFPLAISLVLHAALFLPATFRAASAATPRIEVRLPQLPEKTADRLLKNTLQEARDGIAETISPSQPNHGRNRTQMQAQQRMAAHVFYPPQAVEQGLEGEVRLLLKLDANGRLLEARIASSSGHDLLDRAALDAAHATAQFPGASGELILPVVFRLSE